MDYRELREVMKFLHCKGLMAKDIYADMCDTLGDSAPSYAMVKKWVTEFKRGRISTEDLVRSGRPRDVSTYENVDFIRNLIKDDERVTVQDIAKYVGISFGSVHAILSKLLELVKVSGRWVPRRVTNDKKMTRLEFCKEISAWYRVNPSRLVQQTVIDDAWLYHFERTEILTQAPGQGDVEVGDDLEESTILNKALTGELKVKTLGKPPEVAELKKENGEDKSVVKTEQIEPVSSTSEEPARSKEKDSVQDEKIGSTETEVARKTQSPKEVKPEALPDSTEKAEKDNEVKTEKAATAAKVETSNGDSHDKKVAASSPPKLVAVSVASTTNGSPKVSNGTSSSVPNILAILGQRPVNGQNVPQIIPIMGPHGVTLGQLSGAHLTSILSGANVAQLASLGMSTLNLSQLMPGVPQGLTITQGPAKRPAPEPIPVPKKKLRSGRPPCESSCVFWDSEGVIHVERLGSGQKLTGELYCDILSRLKEAMDAKRPGALDRGVLLLEDQAPAGAKPPRGLQLLPVPVNSPDLSPSDFHVFPKVKEHLRCSRLNLGSILPAVESYLKSQDDSYFKLALSEMERRCTLCVDLNGDYVEK